MCRHDFQNRKCATRFIVKSNAYCNLFRQQSQYIIRGVSRLFTIFQFAKVMRRGFNSRMPSGKTTTLLVIGEAKRSQHCIVPQFWHFNLVSTNNIQSKVFPSFSIGRQCLIKKVHVLIYMRSHLSLRRSNYNLREEIRWYFL